MKKCFSCLMRLLLSVMLIAAGWCAATLYQVWKPITNMTPDISTPICSTNVRTGQVSETETAPAESSPQITLLDVPLLSQHPGFPTGCETAALCMLLQYYGADVTMGEIADALPKGPLPYEQDGGTYGANPEREFVGDPRDPDAFGVYEKPICDTANCFLHGAVCEKGASLDRVKALLDAGKPVIAWFTTRIDLGIERGRSWIDWQTGEEIVWQKHEHAVVAVGYDDAVIYINDPNTGTQYAVAASDFAPPFEKIGGRIVYYST